MTGTRIGALALLALGLSGCPKVPPPIAAPPTRDDLYVVVAGPEGHVGAVVVTAGGEVQTLDQPYAAVRIRTEGRLETATSTPAEVQATFGAALSAQPPRPVTFILYFREGTDELTTESRQAVDQVSAEIARRPAPEVVVIGHTDRVGSVAYNDALSLQRAARVRTELIRLGLVAGDIRLEGRGKREPLVPTEDEVPEPRNRRVEITVR